MKTKKIRVVDITPTWTGIMPGLLAVIETGTAEGKRLAKEELMDLARKVDEINKRSKKKCSRMTAAEKQETLPLINAEIKRVRAIGKDCRSKTDKLELLRGLALKMRTGHQRGKNEKES